MEDEVDETEKKLELKKKEWELDHLQSLKEAEDRKNAEEEDDMFFTYVRDDTFSKVNGKVRSKSIKNKSVKTDSELEILIASDDDDDDTNESPLSPQEKFKLRIQPLIVKLGDDKIAKIKKTAQEAIKARKHEPSVSNSKITKEKRNSASKETSERKRSVGRPKKLPVKLAVQDTAKLTVQDSNKQTHISEANAVNSNPTSNTLTSPRPKKLPVKLAVQDTAKLTVQVSNKQTYISEANAVNSNPTSNTLTSPRVRNKNAITLQEFISHQPNASTKTNLVNNINSQPNASTKTNLVNNTNSQPNASTKTNLVNNTNSQPNASTKTNLVNNTNSQPNASTKTNLVNNTNSQPNASTKTNLVNNTNSHDTPISTTQIDGLKIVPPVVVKSVRTITISAASSPLQSPTSSDGDIRRSSRTPRPKFMDNDWFLFS